MLEDHPELHTGFLAGTDEAIGGLKTHLDRLLDDHVLARTRCLDAHLGVQAARCADADDVDVDLAGRAPRSFWPPAGRPAAAISGRRAGVLQPARGRARGGLKLRVRTRLGLDDVNRPSTRAASPGTGRLGADRNRFRSAGVVA